MLCISRIIHGYTLLLFPLTVVWIGTRMGPEQRPLALGARNSWSTMGIFCGVLSGSILSAFAPSSLIAGMAPGWLNILVSLAMITWLCTSFVDRDSLPSKPPGEAVDQEEYVPWMHIMCVGWSQFSGWMGFVAIEGSLSLMMREFYGIDHLSLWLIWIPVSGLMLAGTLGFAQFTKWKWPASRQATVAGSALGLATGLLLYGVFTTAPQTKEVLRELDWQEHGISLSCLICGIGLLLFAFALTNTLFNSLLMQQLKPHQQTRFQTPVQTLGVIGRGLGPYLGTLLMAYGDLIMELLGPQLLLAFSYTAIMLSVLVPSMFGRRFYDSPRPPML
mmetsp:Transcript_6506/g.16813  ORF Transcript_6506/g.16813 Transcript_6506/m.16813 type:complete len:332 (-) Transcript_6506:290-1285(-)